MVMSRSLNLQWRREKVLVGLSMCIHPCMMMSCLFRNAKGEEMFVSLLFCCQGLRAGVLIATL